MIQTIQDIALILRDLAPMGAVYVTWLGIKEKKRERQKENRKVKEKMKKRVTKNEKKKPKTKNKKLTKVGKP